MMREDEDEFNDGVPSKPDEFQRDDSRFEWSSRAKILKEALDQLVQALRSVDMKYQQLTRWDAELQSQKYKIETRKRRVQQEYDDVLDKLRDANMDSEAYKKYAGVLDVASATVG